LSVVGQEVGFFDRTRTGELINRLGTDTTVLQNTVTANISMGLRWTVQCIGALGALFIVSWKLTLVMIAVVPLIAISTMVYGKFVRKMSKKLQDALAKSTEVAEESISNIRTVRSFSRELYEHERYGERVTESYKKAKNLAFAYGVFAGGVGFFWQSWFDFGVVVWRKVSHHWRDNNRSFNIFLTLYTHCCLFLSWNV